jgi:hypothetical protein
MVEVLHEEQIESLKSDAAKLLAKAHEVANITQPEHEKRAAEFRAQINIRAKACEATRVKLVKPLNDHVKMINAEVKQATNPLEEADLIVVRGLTMYRNSSQVQAAKDAAAQAARDASHAVRMGDLEKMQVANDERAVAAAIAPRAVQTQSGKLTYRKVTRYEIENQELIPAAYWVIDEKKIAATVKAGISIPGVKMWEEEVPING